MHRIITIGTSTGGIEALQVLVKGLPAGLPTTTCGEPTGRIRLSRGPKENYFRPAIDPLFRSAAHMNADAIRAVVMRQERLNRERIKGAVKP